ncbi:unnamed protein product, partial [Prorocentrum cordatum]
MRIFCAPRGFFEFAQRFPWRRLRRRSWRAPPGMGAQRRSMKFARSSDNLCSCRYFFLLQKGPASWPGLLAAPIFQIAKSVGARPFVGEWSRASVLSSGAHCGERT